MADTTQALRATIEATVKDFIQSYADATTRNDATVLSRTLHPDCARFLAPTSCLAGLGIPPGMALTVPMYEGHMAPELNVLASAEAEILACSVDAHARSAALRSLSQLVLKGKEAFPMEFCWFLDFTEDGSKIVKVTMFVDTAELTRYLGIMKEVAAEMEAKGTGGS